MNKIENILKNEFEDKDFFSKNELKSFLNNNNLATNDNSLRQLIYKLTKKGVFQSPIRGIYTTKTKPVFKAKDDNFIIKTRRLFTAKYSEINYCIWTSKWLNDFMIHQPFSHFYIFETEGDMIETAFNLFVDNNINAFLSPDENIIENYISRNENPLIIEKLLVRAPIDKTQNSYYPKPEKILVDIFSDKKKFYFYQGSELLNIFSNFTENYYINYSALYDYAAVRGKKQEIITFLKNNININPLLLR
jgi:hypothetical protein